MDQQIVGSPLAMAPMRFGRAIAGTQGLVRSLSRHPGPLRTDLVLGEAAHP